MIKALAITLVLASSVVVHFVSGNCSNFPRCVDCPNTGDPVCATNGCTFDNECALDCAGAILAYYGPC